jgi:spermidine dehydrogenase
MTAGADPFDIVTARLDYAVLDRPDAPVRIRLNATAVQAANTDDGVAVDYVRGDELVRVRAKQAVLACYNNIIPHLCPTLPEAQKQALSQCVRRPMLIVNVLLRNGQAIARSGISGAFTPGRLCQNVRLVNGVNAGDYHPDWNPSEPCVVHFYAGVAAPQPEGLTMSERNRAARVYLLGMDFEAYEREVRTVLDGLWGPSGLDVANDVLAVMVNRWPHGYARDHIDLEDPAWNADPPPNVVGRAKFGNIAIANSDAGADAYTHTAIDQAWRAVNELTASRP